MITHSTPARSAGRLALVAATTVTASLVGVGSAAAQPADPATAAGPRAAAAGVPDQGKRSCGGHLIKDAAVDNQEDLFKVNLTPTWALRGTPSAAGVAWHDLRNCVSFPNTASLRQ